MSLSFCHDSDQMCIVYMSLNFNKRSLKWSVHVGLQQSLTLQSEIHDCISSGLM